MSSSQRASWNNRDSRASFLGSDTGGEDGNFSSHDAMQGYTSSAPVHVEAFDRPSSLLTVSTTSMRRRNTADVSSSSSSSSSAAQQQAQYPSRSQRSQQQEAGPSSDRILADQNRSTLADAKATSRGDERPRTSPTKLESLSQSGNVDGDPDAAPTTTAATTKERSDSNTKDRWTSTSTVAGETRGEAAGARKQNTACDACRTRKVRCLRTPGEEKCNHCKAKGIDCTTIYVQLATSGVKRPIKRIRGGGAGAAGVVGGEEGELGGAGVGGGGDEVTGIVRYMLLRDGEYNVQIYGLSHAEIKAKRMAPSTPVEARLANATAREEFVSSLLDTYFSTVHIRYPIVDPQEFLQRYHYRSPELGGSPSDVLVAVLLAWGAKFSKHPIILADRRETASEEMTVSQRIRRSVTNPHSAEASSNASGSGGGGARSADTASATRDRALSGADTGDRVLGRSRIADTLAVKAQEVLDRNKAHRVAGMDNAKAAIIAQALYWQVANASDITDNATHRKTYRKSIYICNGSWITSAILQMIDMKVHLKQTIDLIADPSHRGQVAMSWWLACMFDAHMSAFYRRKPLLSAEDYSTEPPLPPPSNPEAGPSPMASEQGYRIWLNSALDQCEMMRSVYFTLWTPAAEEVGVSARKLEKLLARAYDWRDKHLGLVGAPDPDWPSSWRFADAVTACSSDINYQIVWILMWQAVDEFGIAELQCANMNALNAVAVRHGTQADMPTTPAQMDLDRSKINGMRSAIYNEALAAALRCADLSRMLSDFDYLQNEAGIMKYALCEAGYLLTRFRRVEVYKIIDGLRQYGQAFEECYEQADELEMLASEYSKPMGRGQQGIYTNNTTTSIADTSLVCGGGGGVTGYVGHGAPSSSAMHSRYGGMEVAAAAGHRESRGSSGLVRAGSPQNVLPEVGSLMIANLGHDPNHPGMHHFAHHLMQRGTPVYPNTYGPSPPPSSHAASSRMQGQAIVPSSSSQQQQQQPPSQHGGGGHHVGSAGANAVYAAQSVSPYVQASGAGSGKHMQPTNSAPSSYNSYNTAGGGSGIQQQQQHLQHPNAGLPGAPSGVPYY